MSKHFVIINHHGGAPEFGGNLRTYHIGTELVKKGYKVTLFASANNHLLKNDINCGDKLYKEIEIDGINFVFIKSIPYEGNGGKRALNIFVFNRNFKKNYKDVLNSNKPTWVYASIPSPFAALNAVKLKKKYGCKYYLEIRDIWPMTLVEYSGVSKFHPFILLMKWAELYTHKKADKTFSPLSEIDRYLKSINRFKSKSTIIRNGISDSQLKIWENEKVPSNLMDQLPLDKKIVGYIGSFTKSNLIGLMIELAVLMKPHDDVAFVLIGRGEQLETIKDKIHSNDLNNVYVLDPIPNKYVLPVLKEFDVLFKGNPYSVLYEYGVSAIKFAEYLLAGKPILHVNDNNDDIVKELNLGESMPTDTHLENISISLNKLLNIDENEKTRISKTAKEHVFTNLMYSKLVNSIEDAL